MSSQRPSLPTLQVIEDGNLGQVYELRNRVTLIGRNPDCHVRVEDTLISKRHAQLVRRGSEVLLEDLGSRNHTYVDDVRLKAHQPIPLHDGAIVRVCDARYVFRDRSIVVLGEDTPEPKSTVLGLRDLTPAGIASSDGTDIDALRSLVEFGRAIAGSLHLEAILSDALEKMFLAFPQAECGFILMRDDPASELVPKAIRCRGDEQANLTISQTILRNALNQGTATLTLDALEDSRYEDSASVHGLGLRTVMCAPILDRRDQAVGIVQLDTRSVRAQFAQRDLDLLGAFASQVGMAIELARLHEIESRHTRNEREQRFAREVQMGLLPHTRPDVPGYCFWDFYEPAKVVGGDYYDYIALEGQEGDGATWGIALGDVAGKGLAASLMMAKLGSDVRLSVLTESDPVAKVERLNRRLCDARLPDRYVTLLLTLLDTERHHLTVVNAGHTHPIIRRASGAVEQVGGGRHGMMLGVEAAERYTASDVDLGPGDIVVLFTDGINEAMNPQGKLLGMPRLLQAVAEAPGDVNSMGNHILRVVRDHAAGRPQSDDIALLCFGRTAPGAPPIRTSDQVAGSNTDPDLRLLKTSAFGQATADGKGD
jgi:serine phosphatase RsbU (regulator of sigma subunit)